MLIFKELMMKKNIYLLAIVLGTMLLNSCKDTLVKLPLDKPANVTFLQTQVELNLAVNGMYNNLWLTSVGTSGQWEMVLDNATDIGWDRNETLFTFAGKGSHNSSTLLLATVWDHFYTGIGRANYILENMNKVTDASPVVLERADAQARFLRAYWYSQLVTLWGDVPLVVKTQGLDDNQVAKSPKKEIIDLLIADLNIAIQKLPVSWPVAEKGRATKGAALALKSRIALIDSRFDIAAAAAKQIIDEKVYTLYPDYTALFNYTGESNAEVIFEINFQNGLTIHRQPLSVFSRNGQGNSTKIPTQSLVDSYECRDGLTIDKSPLYDPKQPFLNRDPRLRQTIAVPGDRFLGYQFETHKDSLMCWNYNVTPARRVANQDATNPYASFSGYCWRKTADERDLGAFRSASSLNCIVMRYGEVLLNYAEAKIELNQIDQSCLDAINLVRGRKTVEMPPITAGKTQAQMREIIRRERKIELALEGLRLQDIRRWKIAEKVMPGPLYGRPQKPFSFKDQLVPTIDMNGVINYSSYASKLSIIEQREFNPARDYVWPIPLSELDANKKLVQNPNY
jgi:hypothetical protein